MVNIQLHLIFFFNEYAYLSVNDQLYINFKIDYRVIYAQLNKVIFTNNLSSVWNSGNLLLKKLLCFKGERETSTIINEDAFKIKVT